MDIVHTAYKHLGNLVGEDDKNSRGSQILVFENINSIYKTSHFNDRYQLM